MHVSLVLQLPAVFLSVLQVELQTLVFSLQTVNLLLRTTGLKHTYKTVWEEMF